MITPVQMAADYRQAAKVIREGGLAKEQYENDGGQHCLIGALRLATRTGGMQSDLFGSRFAFDEPRVNAEMRFAAGLLGDPEAATVYYADIEVDLGPGYTTITEWNDHPERTAEDVATLLEQAAEKLEAEL